MNIQPITWLVLLVIFLAIELLTMGLTTIWFAGGALAAFLVSLAGGTLTVQIIIFLAAAVLLLIFTRPFAVRYINKDRVKTNADSLIGEHAVVTETIDNLAGRGLARVKGQIWTARAVKENLTISEGATVRIVEIRGVKLMVEPEKDTDREESK